MNDVVVNRTARTRRRRRRSIGWIAALLAATAVVPAPGASARTAPVEQESVRIAAPVAAPVALPTAAVAMGDSFISGEGAGAYQPVVDVNGVAQGFPGWSASNSNAFFCHRSANASIQQANLPGISARFNLACSGGQPHDIANDSIDRASGRTVQAQLDQLVAVSQTHDIDVVLIGLGSNNSSFTFGSVAADCAGRFVADGYIGWWEFWVPIINWITGSSSPQDPCSADDLATPAQMSAAQAETLAAVRQVVQTLEQVDADGEHTIVLQDYTNPLPFDFDSRLHTESRRSDTRDKFRDLVRERYAAGCPAHRASLGPAHQFSQGLGNLVQGVHTSLSAEFPATNLVYLNVQRAFDGARLCERSNSPTGVLATPVRLMDTSGGVPTGVHLTSLNGTDKLDIARIQGVCTEWFQTCQESWHPNAAGHGVLAQCLAAAVAAGGGDTRVDCVRNPSTGAITAT
jgi:lysophospholipase L1-like esterase